MKVLQEGRQTLTLLEWVTGRMVTSLAITENKSRRPDVKEVEKEEEEKHKLGWRGPSLSSEENQRRVSSQHRGKDRVEALANWTRLEIVF